MPKNLYYIHGMDSSPQGFRSVYLKERHPFIRIPALPNDVEERHRILTREIEGPAYVIGNSLGGLSTLRFVEEFPQRVARMVLLAPAVGFFDPQFNTPEILDAVNRLVIPAQIPTAVIAAINDEVIPIQAVESLVLRSPECHRIRFFKLPDSHLLHEPASLDVMNREVDLMLAADPD